MAKVQLIGGLFQDSEGSTLANGYLKFKLNQDGSVPGVGSVCAGIEVTIKLNSSGSVDAASPQYLWANNQIFPANSFYRVTGYTAQGQPAWGPNTQQVTGNGGTFDLGTWVPNQVVSWTPSVSSTLLKTNGTANSNQSVLNLVAGTNMVLTPSGGNVTLDASGGGFPGYLEIDLTAFSGLTRTITTPEAQHAIIRFTGNISADVSVVFPEAVVATWYLEWWVGGSANVNLTTDGPTPRVTILDEDTYYGNDGTSDHAGIFKAVTAFGRPWESTFYIAGKPGISQLLFYYAAQFRLYALPNPSLSICAQTPPTVDATFIVALSTDGGDTWTDYSDATLTAGSRTNTVNGTAGPGIPAGASNVLVRITCPNPQDTTMSDVALTLNGVW